MVSRLFFFLISVGTGLFFLSCSDDTIWTADLDAYSLPEDIYTDGDGLLVDDDELFKEKAWDLTFSFYGRINNPQSTENEMQKGDGTVVIVDQFGAQTVFGTTAWAVKTNVTTMGGDKIPIIQVFWTENPGDGENNDYYVLQVEGNTIQHKREAFFVGNDHLYRSLISKQNSMIKKTCFNEEPESGKIYVLSHDIRIGEYIELKGEADMKMITPPDCYE